LDYLEEFDKIYEVEIVSAEKKKKVTGFVPFRSLQNILRLGIWLLLTMKMVFIGNKPDKIYTQENVQPS